MLFVMFRSSGWGLKLLCGVWCGMGFLTWWCSLWVGLCCGSGFVRGGGVPGLA